MRVGPCSWSEVVCTFVSIRLNIPSFKVEKLESLVGSF